MAKSKSLKCPGTYFSDGYSQNVEKHQAGVLSGLRHPHNPVTCDYGSNSKTFSVFSKQIMLNCQGEVFP